MNIWKEEKSLVSSIWIAVLLLFVWLCPLASEASAMDYAVQVAALRSQQNAVDLTKGLRAQGIDAYWIGKSVQAQGTFYRVRIGRFSTIDSAYLYAEGLMDSGLFNTYAIAAYEAPLPATLSALKKEELNADKLQAFVSSAGDFASMAAIVSPALTVAPPVRAVRVITPTPAATTPAAANFKLSASTIDLIASIGTRGWLLLSTADVLAATQKSQNQTALGRQLAKLAAAVGSRRWSLNNDVATLLARPVPGPAFPSKSAAPVNIADLAKNNISSVNPAASRGSSATPAVRATSTAISAPEIGRRPASPTSPTFPRARPVTALAPPKLQGSIEMRDGKMLMMLQNLDRERAFTGTARITLTTDKDQQDITPFTLNVAPGQEMSIPVTDARLLTGDWMMMVYDQGGVARYIRGASLAPKPAATTADNKKQPEPFPQAPTPPGFVTGMFDANGDWKLTEAGSSQTQAGQTQAGQTQAGQTQAGAPGQSESSGQSENSLQNQSAPPAPPTQDSGPPQVSISPRQIAVMDDNITVEFDIMSSRPLNYIVVAIRSGDYQDSRQALMSTVSGRVPFLIPVGSAKGAFSYEVKDDTGKVLASGSGDFRQFE